MKPMKQKPITEKDLEMELGNDMYLDTPNGKVINLLAPNRIELKPTTGDNPDEFYTCGTAEYSNHEPNETADYKAGFEAGKREAVKKVKKLNKENCEKTYLAIVYKDNSIAETFGLLKSPLIFCDYNSAEECIRQKNIIKTDEYEIRKCKIIL